MVSVYFISLALAALAALGVAAPVDIEKRDSHLKVTLAATAENAVVEATITNTGSTDLTVLKLGSILADSPIKKVKVLSGGMESYITTPLSMHEVSNKQLLRFRARVQGYQIEIQDEGPGRRCIHNYRRRTVRQD